MSATNLTKNLKLSQFVASDKPSWLGDVNGDNKKIDDGYGVLAGEISKANDTASSAKSQSDANTQTLTNVNTELEDHGNRITALEAGGGTEQLEQRVNTLSTDVEALQTRADTFDGNISQNSTDITALKSRVDTIEPKVNANADNITALKATTQGISENIISLTTKADEAKNLANEANAKALVNEGKITTINNVLPDLQSAINTEMPIFSQYGPLSVKTSAYFPAYITAYKINTTLYFMGFAWTYQGQAQIPANTTLAEFSIPDVNKIVYGLGVESSSIGIANNANVNYYLEKTTNGKLALKCASVIGTSNFCYVALQGLLYSE